MLLRFIHNFKILEVVSATDLELTQIRLTLTESGYNYAKRESYDKCFFNANKYLPAGLWKRLMDLRSKKWDVKIENLSEYVRTKLTFEHFCNYISALDLAVEPYPYQIEAAYRAYKYQISKIAVDTGGGKSLIQYMISRFLLECILPADKKVLLVVPAVMLCSQMERDFYDYQLDDYISVDKVHGGSKRNKSGNVVVANIDSVVNYDSDFFEQFGAVLFDEAHKMGTSKQYAEVIHLCNMNQIIQITGLSGTFHTGGIDCLKQDAYLGPTVITVPACEMMAMGTVAKLKIRILNINYDLDISNGYYNFDGIATERTRNLAEINYVKSLPNRIKLISDVIDTISGNQVLLFTSKSYLRTFAAYLRQYSSKKIYEIHGDIPSDVRIQHQLEVEQLSDAIILATYGTLSTGVSIKSVMHLHFINSCKSFIRVVQSIGRSIRLHKDKDFATVWDWVDIFRRSSDNLPGPRTNISARHSGTRKKIYNDRKYEYSIKSIDLSSNYVSIIANRTNQI
jgi:superfamily II DNA or RNA helicase